ncbi:MAG: hypothetical protein HY748_04590 [Elusimicrobia bacterium]|nr:hypothetical protein [Elusimicrobiota bacterium]
MGPRTHRSGMIYRAKWIFWGLVLASVAIIGVPSADLLDTLRSYHRFLTGFEPGTLRPSRTFSLPESPRDRAPEPATGRFRPAQRDLSFVEFGLRAPKAKEVRLAGDFTQWERSAIAMRKRSGGVWEVLVPLPPGRYRYRFIVDGVPVLDPKNPDMEETHNRSASVRVVK